MITHCAQFPPLKSELKEAFGYLSFNCVLINVDVIGIRIIKSGEIVIVTFRGFQKTGYMYEGGNLKPDQVFKVFSDVPEDFNDLKNYEKQFEGKTEILHPPEDNYVFISDKEITKNLKNNTYDTTTLFADDAQSSDLANRKH